MGPTSAFCVASTAGWASRWSSFRPASASPIRAVAINPVSMSSVEPVRTRIMICLRISAPASAAAAPAPVIPRPSHRVDRGSRDRCRRVAAAGPRSPRVPPGPSGAGQDDGRREPAALEATPEPFPAPRQPALQRPDRAAEQPGGLLVGVPLQVAEHDRRAERLGQPVELLVELGPGLRGRLGDRLVNPDPRPAVAAPARAAGRLATGPQRHPPGHAVEPARHRIPPPDQSGPSRQDQERRLAGVLRVVPVAQDSPADPSTIGPWRSTSAVKAASDSGLPPRPARTAPGAGRPSGRTVSRRRRASATMCRYSLDRQHVAWASIRAWFCPLSVARPRVVWPINPSSGPEDEALPPSSFDSTLDSGHTEPAVFPIFSQPPFALGMNPGTPVSTTALNLTRDLIPSLISRMASSGRVETSKFSLIRLGVFEVVRRAVPRWIAQASKTCAGVLLTRLAIAVMTGSSSNLGSLLCPSAAKACSTMPFFLQ